MCGCNKGRLLHVTFRPFWLGRRTRTGAAGRFKEEGGRKPTKPIHPSTIHHPGLMALWHSN